MGLRDVLGNRQQLGHRFEWLASVVLIKAGYDYTNASACEFVRDADQFIIEKLAFINAYDLCTGFEVIENLCCAFNCARFVTHFRVRNDMVSRITLVNMRFEDLDFLPGNLGPPQATN